MQRIFLLLLSTILITTSIHAQHSITGSWYGKAEIMLDGKYDSYLTELTIKQEGKSVSGIFGYYFKNGYQSVYVKGTYNPSTRVVSIKNIPLTYFRSANIDGVNCTMDFSATMIVSKVESSLKGYFFTNPFYKYTCPELNVTYILDPKEKNKQDSLIKYAVTKKIWLPAATDVVVSTKATHTPAAATASTTTPTTTKPTGSTTSTTATPPTTTANVPPVPEQIAAVAPVIAAFEKRESVVDNKVYVKSDSVRISFYDNGEVDGDTISVFLNGQPILIKQGLTAKAINVYVKLDDGNEANTISMFAENLGTYPPNTALMIISDGEDDQEIYLSSTLSKNATVEIRRRKKN